VGASVTGRGSAGTRREDTTTVKATRNIELSRNSLSNSSSCALVGVIKNNVPGMLGVKGALKRHLGWWAKNAGNSYIYSVVEHGYRLPFSNIPESSCEKNNASARQHPEFVEKAIQELLLNGVVKECDIIPYTINPLTVAQNKGNKLRLVLDLRTVNPLIILEKNKFEDLAFASQFFRRHQFFLNFDLKSG
jgi:hypothetical protein